MLMLYIKVRDSLSSFYKIYLINLFIIFRAITSPSNKVLCHWLSITVLYKVLDYNLVYFIVIIIIRESLIKD